MITEQLQAPPQETAEMISYNLDAARREVIGMTQDQDFHEACLTHDPKVDPYDDMASPGYWSVFADHANRRIAAEAEERGGMDLELEAKQLLAETPRYLFAQVGLNTNRSAMTPRQVRTAREVTSGYNNRLRTFLYAHPQTNFDDVKKGALAMAQSSIEDERVLQEAGRTVYATLHGAQPELACGQVLDAVQEHLAANTGDRLEFQPAPTHLDLKGVDWLLLLRRASGTVQSLGIDSKASEHQLDTAGLRHHTLPFSVVGQNQIRAALPLRERDFHGKFFIDTNTAQRLVPLMLGILDQAPQQGPSPVDFAKN